MSLSNLKNKALKCPDVKKEYDELEGEFKLIRTLISMRKPSGNSGSLFCTTFQKALTVIFIFTDYDPTYIYFYCN